MNRQQVLRRFAGVILWAGVAWTGVACARPGRIPAPAGPTGPTIPFADFHTHLFTQSAIARIYQEPSPTVTVPPEVARLLSARAARWNDAAGLAELYTEDSFVLATGPAWVRGRRAVAEHLSTRWGESLQITPIAFEASENRGHLVGYYTGERGGQQQYYGQVLLTLARGEDAVWRIAAETPSFPGPKRPIADTADQLVARLDATGIQRAVVLSTSYWFQASAGTPPIPREVELMRAEHDWLAEQVARHPSRLVGFCSLNPLRDHAIAELQRCARHPHLKGIKLHFGDSRLDVLNPEHVEKAKRLFRAANEQRMPIVVHLMSPAENYGRAHSQAFLRQIVPAAPDIPIQVAHLAGSGPGYWRVDSALAVFAEAGSRNDPLMRNLYFDIATIVTMDMDPATMKLVARRIRELGVKRVLFASDYPAAPELTPRVLWAAFRVLPLTDAEFQTIASNRPPHIQ